MDRDTLEAAAKVCLQVIDEYGGEHGLGVRCYNAIRDLAQQAGDGWIPVSERLPEDGQEVRFVPTSGSAFNGWYVFDREGSGYPAFCRGEKGSKRFSSYTPKVVKVWRPLPAPPNTAAGSESPCNGASSTFEAGAAQSAVPQNAAPQEPISEVAASRGNTEGRDMEGNKPAVAAPLSLLRVHVLGNRSAAPLTLEQAIERMEAAEAQVAALKEELQAARQDAEISFKRRVRGVAAHIKENARALKRFDWEGHESRCRELCAMYLEEIALTMELEDKLAAIDAARSGKETT